MWFLLGAFLVLHVGVYGQATQPAPVRTPSRPVSTDIQRDPELQARLLALESAKQSADPANVVKEARLVIALGLRRTGETQLQDRSLSRAIETFRRSLDFEDTPASRLDLALSLLIARRFDDGLSAVTDVLTSNPQSAEGWYLQGRIWMAKGLYDLGADSFRRSLSVEANSDAAYWLGAAMLKAKQPEQAKAVFQKLLSQSGNRALLHARFSDAYRDAQYMDDAARELRLAAQLDPKIVRTHDRSASSESDLMANVGHWGAGGSASPRPQSPEQPHRYAARLATIVASALNDLGTAEARQQQFALALAHFHEAEGWDPKASGLQRNIGIAAMRDSNYAEAVRALRPVVAANPQDNVARASLGSALFATNAFAEAVQTLQPLGDSVLEHPGVAYAWAASLIKVDKYAEAATLLTRLEATQLSPQMWLLVAQAWSQMGTYPRTVEACHRALQADPKLLTAHYLAGLALIHQDRAADAAAEFRDELQLDPGNTQAQYNLAFVLLQQSQDEEAVTLLREVLARDPQHPEANYELGKQLFRSGHAQDAIPYLETAAREKPGFEPVHYQLQAAYRAVGRKQDADREAKIYRELKAKSRNITLPPPRE